MKPYKAVEEEVVMWLFKLAMHRLHGLRLDPEDYMSNKVLAKC